MHALLLLALEASLAPSSQSSFSDLGAHELKGVSGEWQVYRVG